MTQRNDLHAADLAKRGNSFAANTGHAALTNATDPSMRGATSSRSRRAARIAAALPLEVRDQFGAREETRTQFLTVRGAIFATTSNPRVGYRLTIQNLKNGKSAECHIIGVEPVLKGVHQVEVEFTGPQPEFWPVQFPAEDKKAIGVMDNSPSTVSAMLHSPASTLNGVEKAQAAGKQEPDLLLEVDAPKFSHAGIEPKVPAQSEPHHGQIVVLADSLAQSFTPRSLPVQEKYSSRTAPLDSVAQFRAANRAAHRRERHMKAFYSLLTIAALAGAAVGVRSWTHDQANKPHLNITSLFPSSTPASSIQSTAKRPDSQKSSPAIASTITVISDTAPSQAPVSNAISDAPGTAAAPVESTPQENKPEETQVAVRHAAGTNARKRLEMEEEAPMALPLRAGDDAPQAKPEVLSSVVAEGLNKNPLLAPQAPRRLMPAKLLRSVPAQYPAMARQMHVEGNVVLNIDIDAAGNVSKAAAVSGAPMLRTAAIEAVQRWKYQPATLGDKAIPTSETVKVDFHLR